MATKAQKKLIKLLSEFGSMCASGGIEWSLAERTACSALLKHKFTNSCYEVIVNAPIESISQLRDVIESENGENRAFIEKEVPFDKRADNRRYFYAATDSTLFDFRRSFSKTPPYLAVTVQPAYQTGDGYVIPLKDGRDAHVSSTYFLDTKDCALEGKEFPVSREFAHAFRHVVNLGGKSASWPYKVFVSSAIEACVLPQLPYEDFLARLDEVGCLQQAEKTHDDFTRRSKWMREKLKPLQSTVDCDNAAMELTELRYKFWLKYYPFKKTLLKKWFTGYSKAVAYTLGAYVNALTDLFERTGKAIYFDRELFAIALLILRGMDYPHLNDLRRAVPKGHRKPLIADKELAKTLCDAERARNTL